jgi:hypothetical protein
MRLYPDPITGKSRELDVSAIRPEPVTSDYRNAIWPRLLIECVNNPQPIGFFTKAPNAPTAHICDIKFSGSSGKNQKGKTLDQNQRLSGHGKLSPLLQRQNCHAVLLIYGKEKHQAGGMARAAR